MRVWQWLAALFAPALVNGVEFDDAADRDVEQWFR